MDDTKKLIEKYKRELMELSKQKKTPKVIGYVDGGSTVLTEIRAELSGADESGKMKNSTDLDSVFEEFETENQRKNAGIPEEFGTENQRKNSGIPEEFGTENQRKNAGIPEEFGTEVPCNDPERNSDLPRRNSRENNSRDPGNPSGNTTEITDENYPENSAGNSENFNNRDVVFERTNSSGNITEIIDEYQPELPENSAGNSVKKPKCNSDDPESFGEPDVIFERMNSGNPANPAGNDSGNSDKNYSGKSGGVPGKNVPNYTETPSSEAVRQGITDSSNPDNNVIEQNVSGITRNTVTAPGIESAAAVRTTEEQAERLNDQPVSGQDPDEQLTGRSFEGRDPQPETDVSMEQGSRAEPIEYPEKNFSNFEEFKKVNTGKGSLIFRVYTGREAVVIEGAECVITKKIGDEVRTIARLTTNESGQTPVQELPAPPKELSQHSDNTIQPFSLYDAEVTKPGFIRVVLKDIPIFDGIQSVQKVFMIVE